jgi:hypothetical protein
MALEGMGDATLVVPGEIASEAMGDGSEVDCCDKRYSKK